MCCTTKSTTQVSLSLSLFVRVCLTFFFVHRSQVKDLSLSLSLSLSVRVCLTFFLYTGHRWKIKAFVSAVGPSSLSRGPLTMQQCSIYVPYLTDCIYTLIPIVFNSFQVQFALFWFFFFKFTFHCFLFYIPYNILFIIIIINILYTVYTTILTYI